ncbi:tyrosine-type recombinase/integrase [Ancylobacter sp. IITR112]|uniref:tyrosine-type recombinase/integrase n=1 Tax=Ancylobacter sp. IITR112 TaxID=3138073 RepID=UPI00352BCC8A
MGSKLDKRAVDAAAPREGRYTIWDAELAGFGLRIEPSGRKSYVYRYRTGSGGRNAPERLIVLGRHGELTPAEARRKATDVAAQVRLGADPAEARRKERGIPAFGAFADAYLTEADEIAQARPAEARLRPGSIRNYRSLMSKHLRPALGSMKLDAITTGDIAKLHKRIGRTMPATANRCVEFIGSVYKEAARQGYLPIGTNPARGIEAFKEVKRERFLSAEEVMRLGEAIREAETVGIAWEPDPTKKTKHVPKVVQRTKIDPDAAAALRLLIFTGARLREVLHARWSDVDLERGVLFVHGKTGRRPVILPAPAAAILAGLPRRSIFVFPGEKDTKDAPCPRADLNRPWRAVSGRAGLEGVRLHDLRHSFASFAAAGGASLPIIGRLLGHTQPITTSRYAHLADDPLRAVADRVGSRVAAALDGRDDGRIVPLRAGSTN